MKDPSVAFVNTTGAFPNVLGRNITVPGDGLGTEWIAEFVNNHWGAQQHLLNKAGLTPNGTTEANGASQNYTAMQSCFGAPGEIVAWQGQADPASLGHRLLKCNGTTVLRANYVDLDTACYVGNGNNGNLNLIGFWRADNADGSGRNITGVYLKLPNLQGLFLRGTDPLGTFDPSGATRILPDYQFSAFETHGHELTTLSSNNYAEPGNLTSTGVQALTLTASAVADRLQAEDQISSVVGGTPNDDETRPQNSIVTWCVRY
ncbi:MAG: hypothetical protein ACYSW0_19970 [Planctomycetota bacterium]|jgi:hypothetical protein